MKNTSFFLGQVMPAIVDETVSTSSSVAYRLYHLFMNMFIEQLIWVSLQNFRLRQPFQPSDTISSTRSIPQPSNLVMTGIEFPVYMACPLTPHHPNCEAQQHRLHLPHLKRCCRILASHCHRTMFCKSVDGYVFFVGKVISMKKGLQEALVCQESPTELNHSLSSAKTVTS